MSDRAGTREMDDPDVGIGLYGGRRCFCICFFCVLGILVCGCFLRSILPEWHARTWSAGAVGHPADVDLCTAVAVFFAGSVGKKPCLQRNEDRGENFFEEQTICDGVVVRNFNTFFGKFDGKLSEFMADSAGFAHILKK